MLKARAALAGMLTLFIASGIAASTASASGPFWHVNGSRVELGHGQIKFQSKTPLVIRTEIGTTPVAIECKTSISENAELEGNGMMQGIDKGSFSLPQCKVNATGCEVSPITTNTLKSYLAEASTQTKIVDVFEPTTGTVVATIRFTGAGCLLAGKFNLTGSVAAEIIPSAAELTELLFAFPITPITTVKREGTATAVGLLFSTRAAKFAAAYGARLETGEVFGVSLI
jgi:hypothetical protein